MLLLNSCRFHDDYYKHSKPVVKLLNFMLSYPYHYDKEWKLLEESLKLVENPKVNSDAQFNFKESFSASFFFFDGIYRIHRNKLSEKEQEDFCTL